MLPYKYHTIESQLSAKEVVYRLDHLAQNGNFDDSLKKRKIYYGTVAYDWFKIIQSTGHSERIVIKGTITKNQNYTIIIFCTKPASGLLIFLFFILGTFIMFALNSNYTGILFETGILLFLGLILFWDFYNSSYTIKEKLITLLTEATPNKE